jgi:hypothetical protein
VGDIFQEVDEEVRRDRYSKFWKDYGGYIIAVAVAVVLGTTASVGWQEYTTQRQQEDSDRFAAAAALAAEGKQLEAAEAFRMLVAEAQEGYALLSRFRSVDALKEAGDTSGAVAVLEAIAEDKGVDALYRDLATLLSIMHVLDDDDPNELRTRLIPLIAIDGAWRHSARELSAALALRIGDNELAKSEFKKLADDLMAPSGVRSRAAEILQILGR